MAAAEERTDDEIEIDLKLIESARQGSAEALGQLLERFRPYLLRVAFEEVDTGLRVKESPSDMVQQSFLEASRAFGEFQGDNADVFRDWLRQILINNVRDLRDRFRTDKRLLAREVGTVENVVPGCPADESPPGDAIVREEQAIALARALARLDDESRRLITLRHREGHSFAQIAQILNITEQAARKRWARAIERLRVSTQEKPSDRNPHGGPGSNQ